MQTKRKKYLVYPNFQLRFISWMIGISLLVNFIFYAALIYFFKTYFEYGKSINLPENHIFFQFLSDQMRIMNWIYIITSGITILVIGVFGVFFSHKVAGPLVKLMSHFQRIQPGQPGSAVHFRKTDFFQELSAAYNNTLPESENKSVDESNPK